LIVLIIEKPGNSNQSPVTESQASISKRPFCFKHIRGP